MPVKKYTFKGPIQWAKVFEGNREMKDYQGVEHIFGGLYKIDMILDKDQKKVLKESGSALKGKFDDDGNFIVTFKRKHEGPFAEASGAPKVFKADGTIWDMDIDGTIGNGSIAEVTVEVYTTKMAPGTRLVSVKVLEHKPYVKAETNDLDDEIPH